jgi:hypothetical protein
MPRRFSGCLAGEVGTPQPRSWNGEASRKCSIHASGFARVGLDAGKQAKVTFEVSADRFAYCGRQGRIVDSGAIELMFGHSSTDIAHTYPV